MTCVACVSDLVGARISLAGTRRFGLGRVSTAPTVRASVRACEVAGRWERRSEIDADTLPGRRRMADATEPAHKGRIANVRRDPRGRIASHAHRGATDIVAAPFAVVGEPRMALRAPVCLTYEARRGLSSACCNRLLGGSSIARRARCEQRKNPK
jgi:hypothetical protein